MRREALRGPRITFTQQAVMSRCWVGRWTGTIPELAQETRRTERAVWLAVADLASRGFLDVLRLPDGVAIRTTQQGRATILRNGSGPNPRRTTSPRRNTV